MIKSSILLLLALCFIKLSFSQSPAKTVIHNRINAAEGGIIKGIIKDHDSYRPIEGATAVLKNLADSSKYFSVISNQDGLFKFTGVINSIYSLTISYAGKKQIISNKLIVDHGITILPAIYFRINATQLKAVTVQATPKALIEQKIDRMVINVGSLMANSGTNMLEVLSNSPGIEVTEDGISLRGKPGVTIYIDDKPTYISGKDLTGYLKSLPSGTVDKIEIMPNPPARYNAEGTGGIINIKTKKLAGNGLNTNLSLNYGQGIYSKSNNSINLNYKVNRLNIFGSTGYSATTNYFKVHRDRYFNFPDKTTDFDMLQYNYEKNTRKNVLYKAGFDYDLNKNTTLGFLYSGSSSKYKEKGAYNVNFMKNGITDSTITTNSNMQEPTTNNTLNLNFRHQFSNPSREINFNFDYLNYNDKTNQSLQSNTLISGQPAVNNNYYTLISDNKFKAKVYGAKADYDSPLWGGKLSAGAQIVFSTRNSSGIYTNRLNGANYSIDSLNNIFGYKENINAAYVSFQKDFFKRFSFQAGLRFENTNAETNQKNATVSSVIRQQKFNYNNLFPTAYLTYRLDTNSNNLLIFSAGRRITRPNYADLNYSIFFFDKYSLSYGNPLLVPETSTSLELAYNYNNILTAGINYSSINGMISQYYRLEQSALIATNVNIPEVKTYNIYINSSIPFNNWWSLNVYSELSYSTYKGVILNKEYLDNSLSTFKINGSNQFKLGKGWNAEMSGSYRTRITYGQGVFLPLGRLNAGVQKKILNNKGTLGLTANDIFHTWDIKRSIGLNHAQIISSNINDTQQLNLTFTYKFGLSGTSRVRKNSIQSEEKRVGN
jgi:iron complex outermembrane receptor protein